MTPTAAFPPAPTPGVIMTGPNWPSGDGNSVYLSKTLRYNAVELGLDESVSLKFLFFLWLRAAIASWIVQAVFAIPAILIAVIAVSSAGSVTYDQFGDEVSSGSGAGGAEFAVVLGIIGGALGFIVFWLVLLAYRLPEPIAEWRVLLADRGDRADSVYSAISGTLGHRQLPVGWTVRRIRAGSGMVTNRLVVTYRTYHAYVSVFAYGTSLYLGWAMWRSRRGHQLIGQFFGDLFAGLAGGHDPERQMMRAEPARAMREAVHAACREGLFVAVEGQDVPISFGFPLGLPPIEDDVDRFAAAPGPVAYAGAAPATAPPGPVGPPAPPAGPAGPAPQ